MGKGSTSTSTSNSSPPPQFLNAYQNLVNAAGNVASQPLKQYGGPMIAGFTPEQNAAMGTINNAQGIAAPFINTAAQYASQSATPITPGAVNQSTIDQYYNPFQNDVINATQAQFDQQNATSQNALKGSAIAQGAWGGDRSGIAQAQLAQNQKLAQDPIIAQLESQGYGSALNEANVQQGVGIGAQQANNASAGNAAFMYGLLGPSALNTTLTGAGAQMNAGNLQQQLAQEQLNVPYEQFVAQQAAPYQNLNWLSNIVEGTGSLAGGTSGTNTTTTQPWYAALGLEHGGIAHGTHLAYGGLPDVPDPETAFIPDPSGSPIRGSGPPAPRGSPSGAASKPGGLAGMAGNAKTLTDPKLWSNIGDAASGAGDALSGAADWLIALFHDGGRVQHRDMGGGIAAGAPMTPFDRARRMASIQAFTDAYGGAPTHLAGGGSPVTYLPSTNSRGISTPQVDMSIFSTPSGNEFNPLPQYHSDAAPITTPMPSSIASNLFQPPNSSKGKTTKSFFPFPSIFNPAPPGVPGSPTGGTMNTPGAEGFFRHGGIAHFDDGGSIDDPDQQQTGIAPPVTVQTDKTMTKQETPAAWKEQATHFAADADKPKSTGPDQGPQSRPVGGDLQITDPEHESFWQRNGLAPTLENSPNGGLNYQPGWGRAILKGIGDMGTHHSLLAGISGAIDAHDIDEKPEIDHSGRTTLMRYNDGTEIDTGIPTEASINAEAVRDQRGQAMQDREWYQHNEIADAQTRESDEAANRVELASLRAQGLAESAEARALTATIAQENERDRRDALGQRGQVSADSALAQAGKEYHDAYYDYLQGGYRKGAPPQGQWIHNRQTELMGGASGQPSSAASPAPAARPQTAPAQTAANTPVVPPLPPSVPAGSMWSKSRQMFKDPSGRLYNAAGKPIQ